MKRFIEKYNFYLDKHLELKSSAYRRMQTSYNLSDWKNKIFTALIHILVILGVPLLLFGAYMFVREGHVFLGGIEAGIALTWILTISLPVIKNDMKKFFITLSLYILGVFLLVNTGPQGAGFITINFALILSGCILERRAIKQIVSLNILTFIGLSLLMSTDLLAGLAIYDYKGFWLINGLTTQITGIALLGLMHVIYMGLDRQNTKIKSSRRALQNNEVKYKDMMTNIFDVITILDEHGIVVYMSPNIRSLFGWDSAELLGKSFFTNIHDDDKALARSTFNEMVSHPEKKIIHEYRYQKACGDYVYIEITGSNHLKHPSIQGILANFRDITHQKESERQLLDAKEMAEAATKTKGQFLSVMSHEIRTPLNGIMGMLQLMEMTDLSEEQREYITISSSASNHLLTLINDILDYSKIDADKIELEMSEISIGDLMNKMKQLFIAQVRNKDIDCRYHMDDRLPEVLIGDKHRIKQVLFNLMSNAIKFTDQGSIDLSVALVDLTDEEAILRWTVKDTGIGLSKDQMRNIFEMFSQGESSTTRKYGGSGLGLSISKGLVHLMGGDIWVESQPGQGSEFSFTCVLGLPGPGINRPEKDRVLGQISQEKVRVLIAEDDDFSRFLLKKLGEKLNWQVDLAENGQEAVDFYQSQSYDLILMDVNMPLMDGLEATRRIRALDQDVPIIGVSAFALTGDGQKCLDQGMSDYISKPVDMKSLHEIISKWIT